MFEQVTVNNVGVCRQEVLDGRKYFVAPMTMIVPGVLPGSKGPLLYRLEDIRNTVKAWNNVPITKGHPKESGNFVSGRNPKILEKYGLGRVFNAHIENNELKAEGWFDIENVRRKAPELIGYLSSNQPIELSTGLDTQQVDGPGTFNGVDYTAVAADHRPDHLAILLHEKGACSLNDGCGLNVNSQILKTLKEEEGLNMARKYEELTGNAKDQVDTLTVNCACWKDGKETLASMSDAQIDSIYNAETADAEDIENADDDDKKKKPAFLENASDEELKKEVNKRGLNKKTDNSETDDEKMAKLREAQNKTKNAEEEEEEEKPTANLSDEDRFAVEWAKNQRTKARVAIVNELTANLSGTERKNRVEMLRGKSLEELEDLQSVLVNFGVAPTNNTNNNGQVAQTVNGETVTGERASTVNRLRQVAAANYGGIAGGVVTNAKPIDHQKDEDIGEMTANVLTFNEPEKNKE